MSSSYTCLVQSHSNRSAAFEFTSFLNKSLIISVSSAAISLFKFPFDTFPTSLGAAFLGFKVSQDLTLKQNLVCITVNLAMIKCLCLYDPEYSLGIIHSFGSVFALAQGAQMLINGPGRTTAKTDDL